MLKRIKDINEALPGMLLIECIYLVVAQIIIFIVVPNKIMCAVGLLAGVIYAVFSSFHLSFTIRKVVAFDFPDCVVNVGAEFFVGGGVNPGFGLHLRESFFGFCAEGGFQLVAVQVQGFINVIHKFGFC